MKILVRTSHFFLPSIDVGVQEFWSLVRVNLPEASTSFCDGVTASASSPEWLVQEIIGAFSRCGAAVELMRIKEERIHFPLPKPADE